MMTPAVPLAYSRPPAARWASIYWPAALTVCISVLMGAPGRWTGAVLAGGTGVLGIPELAMLLTHRWQNTLSEWCWRTLRVVKNQPVSQWSAAHYFAAALELVVAGRAMTWTVHYGPLATASVAAFAVWLWPHLFVAWWRG